MVRASAAGSVLGEPACVLQAGVIRTSAGTFEARLSEIYDDVVGLVREFRPDIIVLEDIFGHVRVPRAAISVAHARGVLCLAASQAGVPVVSIAPAAVKRAVSGNGRAPKAQVQTAVRRLLCVRGHLDSHAADALALATTALRRDYLAAGRGFTLPVAGGQRR